MQENDISKICVGSLIIWCKRFREVNLSFFAPLKLVLSLMHQLHNSALKSPNTAIKNGFQVVALSKFNFRFFINELNSP